jgi:hypothetical protein
MAHIVQSRCGTKVLCQLDGTPTFWGDALLAEFINHKFTVRFPTSRGAIKAAAMHGGVATTLEE